MKSPTDTKRIKDPRKRLAAAAALVDEARAAVDAERADREMAIVIARLDENVPLVQIYRDPETKRDDISRGMFNRILLSAPTDDERAKIIAEHPEKFGDGNAHATARAALRRFVEYKATVKAALRIRDDLIYAMLHGTDDNVPLETNAKIADLTGLSTARIAQMRTGNGN